MMGPEKSNRHDDTSTDKTFLSSANSENRVIYSQQALDDLAREIRDGVYEARSALRRVSSDAHPDVLATRDLTEAVMKLTEALQKADLSEIRKNSAANIDMRSLNLAADEGARMRGEALRHLERTMEALSSENRGVDDDASAEKDRFRLELTALFQTLPEELKQDERVTEAWNYWFYEIGASTPDYEEILRIMRARHNRLMALRQIAEPYNDEVSRNFWNYPYVIGFDPFRGRVRDILAIAEQEDVLQPRVAQAYMGDEAYEQMTGGAKLVSVYYHILLHMIEAQPPEDEKDEDPFAEDNRRFRDEETDADLKDIVFDPKGNPWKDPQDMVDVLIEATHRGLQEDLQKRYELTEQPVLKPQSSIDTVDTSTNSLVKREVFEALKKMYDEGIDRVTVEINATQNPRTHLPYKLTVLANPTLVKDYFGQFDNRSAMGWGFSLKVDQVITRYIREAKRHGDRMFIITREEFLRQVSRTKDGVNPNVRHNKNAMDIATAYMEMMGFVTIKLERPYFNSKTKSIETKTTYGHFFQLERFSTISADNHVHTWIFNENSSLLGAIEEGPRERPLLSGASMNLEEGSLEMLFERKINQLHTWAKSKDAPYYSISIPREHIMHAVFSHPEKVGWRTKKKVVEAAQNIGEKIVVSQKSQGYYLVIEGVWRGRGRGGSLSEILIKEYPRKARVYCAVTKEKLSKSDKLSL